MKALSLKQPFASLLFNLPTSIGVSITPMKTIETRSWPTKHRGRIAVHASGKIDGNDVNLWEYLKERFKLSTDVYDLPYGAIIGTIEITDCMKAEDFIISDLERSLGNYSSGRFGWVMKYPRLLAAPIPIKGALSLWTVPNHLESQLG